MVEFPAPVLLLFAEFAGGVRWTRLGGKNRWRSASHIGEVAVSWCKAVDIVVQNACHWWVTRWLWRKRLWQGWWRRGMGVKCWMHHHNGRAWEWRWVRAMVEEVHPSGMVDLHIFTDVKMYVFGQHRLVIHASVDHGDLWFVKWDIPRRWRLGSLVRLL